MGDDSRGPVLSVVQRTTAPGVAVTTLTLTDSQNLPGGGVKVGLATFWEMV